MIVMYLDGDILVSYPFSLILCGASKPSPKPINLRVVLKSKGQAKIGPDQGP